MTKGATTGSQRPFIGLLLGQTAIGGLWDRSYVDKKRRNLVWPGLEILSAPGYFGGNFEWAAPLR